MAQFGNEYNPSDILGPLLSTKSLTNIRGRGSMLPSIWTQMQPEGLPQMEDVQPFSETLPAEESGREPSSIMGKYATTPRNTSSKVTAAGTSGFNYVFDTAMQEDDKYFNILNRIQTATEQKVAATEAENQNLRDYQKMLADTTIVQPDITPILSFVDATTGSKMASTYKPPETVQERISAIQTLQSKIDKNKQDEEDFKMGADAAALKTELARADQRQKNELQAQAVGLKLATLDLKQSEMMLRKTLANKPKALTPKQVEGLQKNESARAAIQDFIQTIQQNPSRVGLIAKVKSMDPTSSSLTSEEKIVAGKYFTLRQIIGTPMEGGVLREGDWSKYGVIVGDIGSNPSTALGLLRNIEHQLGRDYVYIVNDMMKAKMDAGGFIPNANLVKQKHGILLPGEKPIAPAPKPNEPKKTPQDLKREALLKDIQG